LEVARLHAARRNDAQHVRFRVVHEQRGAARPHHRRDFVQDPLRRLVQPDRVTEDLADRVDQIDLLVALRQLRRDLDGVALGGQHGADDLGELPSHPRACARVQWVPAIPDLEPHALDSGNRLEPCRSARGIDRARPQAQARPGEPLQHRQHPLETLPGQPARSVRHTEFPLALKATWSTRRRSTNSPRPSSSSRRSGSVGSGTSSGSNPSPSSVTCRRTTSCPTWTSTRTTRAGSWWLPYAMALARASARAVRKLKRMRRGERGPDGRRSTISSTAGPTYFRSLGTSSDSSVSVSPPPARRRTSRCSGVVTG